MLQHFASIDQSASLTENTVTKDSVMTLLTKKMKAAIALIEIRKYVIIYVVAFPHQAPN